MNNFNFNFFFDPLSLFFLFVILIVSSAAALYSYGYLKGQYSAFKIALAWILLVVFVFSMALVVTAGNLLIFLIAWELMSLVSYFFVVFDFQHERSVKAGMIYIVMTHIGTAFLIGAFLIMHQQAHSFDLISIKNACQLMPAQTKNIVFLLLLAGFGTKAGIVPLHIWLPYAHPQAPSHISSIMSGVMVKTAIYGIIRFVIFTLGVNNSWWGSLVLVLAVVTCLVGIIYALMETDIKRLLAYSSVENIGIILLGVGLAMVFIGKGWLALGLLALTASLYHLMNHAFYKGLLFFCAGSVYKATGTRDMEKLGGLIKKMPQTAFYFLLAAAAISALPPLNGFISEWMTLQAFFLGAINLSGNLRFFLVICAALLALTSALTAACFVKAFGVTFLALPRGQHSLNAQETSWSMKAGMFILAALVVISGLAVIPIIKLLARAANVVIGVDTAQMVTHKIIFSPQAFLAAQPENQNVYLSTPLLAVVLLILAAGVFCVYRLFGKKKQVVYKTWDCGYYKLSARNEYTATAFSKPFRIAFSFFLLPYRKTQKIRESFYHVKAFFYETHTTPVFRKYVYYPLLAWVLKSARLMRRMQPGSIHLYLSYILATILLLVIFINKF